MSWKRKRHLVEQEMIVTTAPLNLRTVGRPLLAELGPHGPASAEVGVVGDPAHRGGYPCGRDRAGLDVAAMSSCCGGRPPGGACP